MENYERGKLDGQILQELKDLNGHVSSLVTKIEGQEGRIRILENFRWWFIGGSISVGIGAAKITSAMMNL